MKNVRIWFEKKDSARFISHLDLTRCMTRALRLSRLPVWYTQGFNPRVYMAFAMPLSLGAYGEKECMDIRLTEEIPFDEIARRLGERLPEGLPVRCAAEPVYRLEDAAWADYELFLAAEDPAGLADKLRALLAQEAIPVMKHTKKGEREMDIRPYFQGMEINREEDGVSGRVRLPCSTAGSVNPALLLDALGQYTGEEPLAQITRKGLLTQDFSEFR